MSPLRTTVHHSPVGPLRLVAGPQGLRELAFVQRPHAASAGHAGSSDDAAFHEVREQLDRYFSGELRRFDLPLDPVGTPFQLRVWEALHALPYGATISYGELARRLGTPRAARAVGLANGRNPLPILVPCHRVVGADGRLTGYSGGLARKTYLLELERRAAGVPSVA
ncbi:methylated-DNA--[protein]-cysteine S-methyltransferase [Paraconexibacter sp.]|uniref:methylated-DNA--[protein]-cysteine S-methyltransferase n=1 Tax=Paraconexibacter sp. TaxID=2949640 RepID=UPI0035678F29